MYSDQPVRYYQTHARGRVEARTWRTLTASIPLTAQVKAYTGEEKSRFTLTVLGYPVEFYQNAGISWPWYDKISTVYQAGLPGGLTLPLSWTVGGTGPMSPSRRRWTAPPPRLCWRSACWRS